jgi:hypothetical protein
MKQYIFPDISTHVVQSAHTPITPLHTSHVYGAGHRFLVQVPDMRLQQGVIYAARRDDF